jgi:hypothetical protein
MLPKKPTAPPVQANNIPRRLRRLKRWLLWCYESVAIRWAKVPYGPNGYRLKWKDPKNLLTFKEALAAYRRNSSFDGVGFVFFEEDGNTGVDWDSCIDDEGNIESWAQEDLDQFAQTYIEITPSKKGFHALCLGTTPRSGAKKWKQAGKEKDPGVEIYSKDRWFAVTGYMPNGKEIVDCQPTIDSVNKKYFDKLVLQPGQAAHKHNNGKGNDDPSEAELQAAILKLPPRVDEDELVKALTFVPCDDRKWIDDLHAIKHAKLPNGYQIAYDWSEKSAHVDPDDWPEVWNKIKPDGRYTVSSIFYKAMQNGYQSPKKYKRDDIGNSERFADQHRHHLRWFASAKTWLEFTGKIWEGGSNGNK